MMRKRRSAVPVHPLTQVEEWVHEESGTGTRTQRARLAREARHRMDQDAADRIAVAIRAAKHARNPVIMQAARDMLLDLARLAGESFSHEDLWHSLEMSDVYDERSPRRINARWHLFFAGVELLRTGQWCNLRRCVTCSNWFLAYDDRCAVCPDDRRCAEARRDRSMPATARKTASRIAKRELRAAKRRMETARLHLSA